MTVIEIAFVKAQPKKSGGYQVTIPAEAVKALGIVDNERMKVYLEKEKRRVIFELAQQG